MTIQDQLQAAQVTDENLRFFKAIGVDYLTIYPPPEFETGEEFERYFKDMKKLAASHGLKLHNIAMRGPDEITLALPGRDKKIEEWKQMLRAMGRAGIPTLGYNFKPIGNFRTTATHGRGGAVYSTFDYDEYARNVPDHPGKQIDEAAMWAHIEYFLTRIVPVAEENGVRMALHPDDPPIPDPMAGAARIVSTLDQYRRIFDIAPGDANGMLFCQGCVTEMGVDVPDAIRAIGSLGKIVYVHFRNVRRNAQRGRHAQGAFLGFQEVFLDEGDVDMFEAMKTYREVGFEGPFMMDHTPGIPGDREGREGHAFATGYIRALIQAVYR